MSINKIAFSENTQKNNPAAILMSPFHIVGGTNHIKSRNGLLGMLLIIFDAIFGYKIFHFLFCSSLSGNAVPSIVSLALFSIFFLFATGIDIYTAYKALHGQKIRKTTLAGRWGSLVAAFIISFAALTAASVFAEKFTFILLIFPAIAAFRLILTKRFLPLPISAAAITVLALVVSDRVFPSQQITDTFINAASTVYPVTANCILRVITETFSKISGGLNP